MKEYIIKVSEWVIDVNGNSGFKDCEEIVRCKDCKFYVKDPDPIDPGWPMMCEWTELDMIDPNGFCAWGERRDDDN